MVSKVESMKIKVGGEEKHSRHSFLFAQSIFEFWFTLNLLKGKNGGRVRVEIKSRQLVDNF
ncbi:MAG: hypothetical protein A2175_00385 [Candidatus Nealsonbacteria bacterium RBG_13_42_11]|uniref:Uncharacterized protein n=1 Tax=Candidatus Nealsonbacteria bacterium RBG_13_42_11 TaxID=1801663 RepID=A0A1G2DZC5_9BACT|nr:MAG: hypothetical protein A2175_00385 [Candidatus Nealsonbacteria bacterium RBG_13_42_11]